MSNASVIDAIRSHHASMAEQLSHLTSKVVTQAASCDAKSGRDALVAWCNSELLPHAAAEEPTIYRAGAQLQAADLLVRAMTDEHRAIKQAVGWLQDVTGAAAIAAAAGAVKALFDVHLTKENDLLLPMLDEAGIDLAPLLAGMHELVGT